MDNFFKKLINFLEYIGEYANLTFFCLILLVIGLILIKILKSHKNISKSISNTNNTNNFGQLILDNSESAFLVLRKTDNMPIYTNPNFENIVGLNKEKVTQDFEVFKNIFSYDELSKIRYNYENWNRKTIFKYVFFNLLTNHWLEIKVCYKNCINNGIDNNTDNDYELISFTDVTHFINEKNEISEKLKKAEITSRSKTEFLSKMSHDIRTPMNGILGMLSIMKINLNKSETSQNILQYIEKAESLSQFLLNLINDILDISRIEAGKIKLAEETFNLNDFAKKVDTMFRKTIEEKNIEFNIELLDIENPYVIGDEFRISQVIINFISNAIKFTENGKIQFKIAQVNSYNGIGSYLFSVKDTGKGIEPNFIKNLFKPFEQESTKIAKKYGGSGLGMAIADQIVHIMNGEIVVDSVVGGGTTFTVYVNLPISKEPENILQTSTTQNNPNTKLANIEFEWTDRHILLAEDNEINAEICVELLGYEGAIVDVAQDGQKVIEKFTEMGKDYYDIILMDIQMPVKNGWEATKIIRQMKDINGDSIPIFALSADAFVEDKRKSTEIGMNGHISKPIDYVKLKEIVGSTLNQS